jgi:hypothetical protein
MLGWPHRRHGSSRGAFGVAERVKLVASFEPFLDEIGRQEDAVVVSLARAERLELHERAAIPE